MDWAALITIGCQPQGTACNDNAPCTTQDVYDNNCNCAGTALPDSDNDGVCNNEDVCPNGNDAVDVDNDNIPDDCDDCIGNSSGSVEIVASEDAYLQGNTNFNTNVIRIENGNRVAYLKFDLSGIADPINSVELQLSTETDGGNGTLQVYASNSTNWSQTNLTTANAPGNDKLVGSFSGTYTIGSTYTAALNGVNTNAPFTIIIVQSPGGNDVAFASTEFSVASKRPKLIVTTGGDCLVTNPDCNGFAEENGLVVIEAENLALGNTDWNIENSFTGYTGNGYIVWRGANLFGTPGTGLIEANINITNPGTYLIEWRNRIGQGTNTTEHNDSWLKFPDADEFFAQQGNNILYPIGSGQTPNPNGAGAAGWFKVYLSGFTTWSWSTRTSDNQGYQVYVKFDNPGNYTMQLSGRSFNHVIDRITLSKSNVSNPQNLALQQTDCDENSICTVGGACNDGNICTTGEVYDANCNCNGGIIADADNDGVCDSNDICPGGDDAIDTDNDNIPDACDNCIPNSNANTVIEVSPVADAYLEGNVGNNNTVLRIESGNRVAFLKFNLSSIAQPITKIELQISNVVDTGNGTIEIYASNNTSWTETNLSAANAPGKDSLVGSLTGNYTITTAYTANLSGLNNNNLFSIVLAQLPGGNDVAFGAREYGNIERRPKLLVTVSDECIEEEEEEEEECQSFIIKTNNSIQSTSLSAKNYIESNNIIPANTNVEFTAGQSILMTDGFEVKQGVDYRTYIYDCDDDGGTDPEPDACYASTIQEVRDCLKNGKSVTLSQDILVGAGDCDGNGVLNVSGLQNVGIYGQGYRIYRNGGQLKCSLLYGKNTTGFFSDNVVWEEIEGPEVPPLNTYKRTIHFIDSDGLSFERSEVAHGWDYSLYLNGVNNFKFTNSIFRDSGVLGLYVGHGSNASTNVEIRNNTFIRNTTNAIALLGAKNVVIEDNLFDNNHLIGVFAVAPQFGTGFTGGGQVYIAEADQVLFTNNTIQNGTCSNCYTSANLGTHVTGLELGIPNRGTTVTNTTISNNTIINNHAFGIHLNSNATLNSTTQICGNTISGNGVDIGVPNANFCGN